MKKIGLVFAIALLICLAGVSCKGELATAECNLILSRKGLNISGVTYQYSVLKINRGSTSLVRDWTNFSDLENLVIKDLTRGKYTFSVRGVSTKSNTTMYEGSTTCYLSSSSQQAIEIVLNDCIDLSKTSTLKIELLNTALNGCTASVKLTEKRTGTSKTVGIDKSSSGFSSTYTLTPGYYDVAAFVYQEGVEVGGIYSSVFVPSGYDEVLKLNIEVKKINGTIYKISEKSSLTVDVGANVSLAWSSQGGSGNFGQWKIGNTIVENRAFYLTLPTSESKTYTVEYQNGSTVKKCEVTVGGKKTKVSILNFMSADGIHACIGYEDKNGVRIPIAGKEVDGEGNIYDYTDFGIKPILVDEIGTSEFAQIVDLQDFDTTIYGEDIFEPNNTLKVLVTGGDIASESLSRLTALETVVLREPDRIEIYGFFGLDNLKTVYIFPASGKTSIEDYAFYGCLKLTDIYIIGNANQIDCDSGWLDGTNLTGSNIHYVTAIPL